MKKEIKNNETFLKELYSHKFNFESEYLDYKVEFHFDSTRERLELVKDIVSFANTEGGAIVFGVRNKTYDWIGLDSESDDIDDITISDMVFEYTGKRIDFKCGSYTINGNVFYLITINKEKTPVAFIKNGEYSRYKKGSSKQEHAHVFKKDSIYGRVSSSSREVTNDLFFFEKREKTNHILTNLNDIPSPYVKYVDRKKEKDQLIAALQNNNIRHVRINGIGGIGKTSFVRNLCDAILSSSVSFNFPIDSIIWITGKVNLFTPSGDITVLRDTLLTYREMLNSIANCLFIDSLGLSDDELCEKIYDKMSIYSTLLILDNMETIKDARIVNFYQNVPFNCHIIFTSRTDLATSFTRIDLAGFDKDQFFEFINNSIDEYKPDKKDDILETVIPHINEFKKLTRGSPILIKLIMHKICNGHNINPILSDLKNISQSSINDSFYYNKIMDFCFNDTFETFSKNELEILFIMSLSDDEDEDFELSDLSYISQKRDQVVDEIVSSLVSCSFCSIKNLRYSCSPLIKAFANKKITEGNLVDITKLADNYYAWRRRSNEMSEKRESFYEKIKAFSLERKIVASEMYKAKTEYFDNHNLDEMMNKYDELIDKNPDFGYLYFDKARFLKDFSDVDDNIIQELYKKAIELEPNSDYFISEYAFYLSQKGDKKNAAKYFKRALEIMPHLANINHGYAVCLSSLYGTSPDLELSIPEIIKYFEKGYVKEIRGFSDKTRYCSNAHKHSSFLLKIGKPDDALLVCDRALEIMPYDSKLLGLRGNILKKLNPDIPTKTQIRKFKTGLFAALNDDDTKKLINIGDGDSE